MHFLLIFINILEKCMASLKQPQKHIIRCQLASLVLNFTYFPNFLDKLEDRIQRIHQLLRFFPKEKPWKFIQKLLDNLDRLQPELIKFNSPNPVLRKIKRLLHGKLILSLGAGRIPTAVLEFEDVQYFVHVVLDEGFADFAAEDYFYLG